MCHTVTMKTDVLSYCWSTNNNNNVKNYIDMLHTVFILNLKFNQLIIHNIIN